MSKYTDNSIAARLLDAVILVYDTSVLKKIFSAIGELFKKHFFGSVTSKVFTIFDFEAVQYEQSSIIKILKAIASPFELAARKFVEALTVSAESSVCVKLVRSCANMSATILKNSVLGKIINLYLEGEN